MCLLVIAASELLLTSTHYTAPVAPLRTLKNGSLGKTETVMYPSYCSLLSLNEVQWPNRNHLRRLNTLLVVSIFEARNLERKKRYYCEIYLNDILYAQTCCKIMNDILFWGEPFVFE